MSELNLVQVDYQPTPSGYEHVVGSPQALKGVQPSVIEYDDLVERFKEGNDTYSVVAGPSGRKYETVVFNADKLPFAAIMKPSTSFSSAYKNPGNMLETALAAAANPGSAYIYVGTFGNYPTGHMPLKELVYVSKTGRYTSGDGSYRRPYQALGSVQDMAETVAGSIRVPTHLSADAEAGRVALALMAAFPTDSIKGANLNGVDGISKTSKYIRSRLTEDLQSRIRRRGIGAGEPGEATPLNIKDVKRHMPAIYSGLGRIAHLAPLPVFLFPRDVRDKVMVTLGHRTNNDLSNLADHALYHDTQAALRNQDATILMQFGKESESHNIDDCVKFGKIAMDHLPLILRSDQRRIRLLISEGKLDWQTDDPHGRARIDRLAFPDIMHQMKLLSGMLSDTQVFNLPPVKIAS